MTYSVIWKLSAIQDTNRIEQNSDDPTRIRAAVARIDYLLRRMPRDLGESRDPGFRIWFEDVLGVYYRLDELAMTVEVLFAGPARRR